MKTILVGECWYWRWLCNSNADRDDSVDSANDMNDRKNTSGVLAPLGRYDGYHACNRDVADFAVEAANGGMMEVELGKNSAAKSGKSACERFGAMMVQDHSAANDKLKKPCTGKKYHTARDDWKRRTKRYRRS